MGSTILGNPIASGPQFLFSGNPYSGRPWPTGQVTIRLDRTASGNAYVYATQVLSGEYQLTQSGMLPTFTSGGMYLSGGGISDGMILYPGDAYTVPRAFAGISGQIQIGAYVDQAGSGQARLWFEIF